MSICSDHDATIMKSPLEHISLRDEAPEPDDIGSCPNLIKTRNMQSMRSASA